MTATNITRMERLAQTKEELEYLASKYANSLFYYNHATIYKYPKLNKIKEEMEENRAALVEWAIAFNNEWNK